MYGLQLHITVYSLFANKISFPHILKAIAWLVNMLAGKCLVMFDFRTSQNMTVWQKPLLK